jgi:hypothetical protein
MLVALFRVLAWLTGIYGVLVNVVAIVWAFTTLASPFARRPTN